MKRERTAWVEALERLGLLKYILASLFTGMAFTLIAGAFYYDWRSHRPAVPPTAILLPPMAARQAPPGHMLRAPVSRTVRYTAAPERLALAAKP